MQEPAWSLVTYRLPGRAGERVGVRRGGRVHALPEGVAPDSMLALLDDWDVWEPRLRRWNPEHAAVVADARLLAPLRFPRKVVCAGANYHGHLAEMGVSAPVGPVHPYFFLKPPTTTVIGPDEPVLLPSRVGRQIDWEVELGVVIGRRARNVRPEEALEVVAGWTVVNDVSARDLLEFRGALAPPFGFDWLASKGGDTFCPLGPGIVPVWLVDDPQALHLRLSVNGVVKQDSTTADMVVPVTELISAASAVLTLEPGDVLATGTPAGVGAPRGDFLRPGDTVVAEIDGLGRLTSPVAEAANAFDDDPALSGGAR